MLFVKTLYQNFTNKIDTDLATAAMERQQKRLVTIADAQAKMAANKQTRQDMPGELLGPWRPPAPRLSTPPRRRWIMRAPLPG